MTTDTQSRLAALLTEPPAGRVYSYSRFSTPEQAKGDSSRRQAAAAERWAARRGLVLDSSLAIHDEGVSAFRGANAADGGLARFLEACRRGLIEPNSFLLVESLDRISRMPPRKAQTLFNEIVDAGVTIVTLNDDQEYTAERMDNDPTSLLIALMVAWRAHEESKTKGRRVAAAWAEKRRKIAAGETKRMTARGPSWLLLDGDWWKEDPAKAKVVRRVFAMTLAGLGEHSIAKTLNGEGVAVFGRGKQWHRSTICKLLRNPAVIGTLVPGHLEFAGGIKRRCMESPVPHAFPAVISEADWLAVRAMKDGTVRHVRGRHSAAPVAHLLAGLARCPACGAAMTRVNKGSSPKGGKPKLVCTKAKVGAGCSYVSVSIERVEEAIKAHLGVLLDSAPSGDGHSSLDRDIRHMEGAVSATQDLLQDLTYTFDRSPSSILAQRITRVEAELRLMRAELAELDERRQMTDKGLVHARLGELWSLVHPDGPEAEPADTGRVNAALKVLFLGVVVDYRQGGLRFLWRQGGETGFQYAWND
ncbi:DNA invertase Pin-like site-specific DNA recombinase [Sphingobium sp. B2D3A]|uniref:recombinase family protein n=1 Tax=unclassified Sphingobium TaxID=2611147 RepID=UPI0022256824|nr:MULTISPECIES: recombinase family protein [unclassified Sphingobium]MCW2336279.1 DNA invertase Pin-like site-specific DNA recombinase [Sphingobium sp. B2D3A]MCW2386034.1 DNA invertase Pin-like site-specific DNA recombinase [Sphingobium sp. B2D3D]